MAEKVCKERDLLGKCIEWGYEDGFVVAKKSKTCPIGDWDKTKTVLATMKGMKLKDE